MIRSWRSAFSVLWSVCGPALLSLAWTRQALESRATLQVLVLLPLLILSGFACRALTNEVFHKRLVDMHLTSHDADGLVTACAALAAISFWLIPSALDASLGSVRMGVAKYASFWIVGFLVHACAFRAVAVLQLFLVASVAIAVFAVGIIYLTSPDRLFSGYRIEDQTAAGTGLITGSLIAIAWVLFRTFK